MQGIKTEFTKNKGLVEKIVDIEEAGFFIENEDFTSANSVEFYTSSAVLAEAPIISKDIDIALIKSSGSGQVEYIYLPDEDDNIAEFKVIEVLWYHQENNADTLHNKRIKSGVDQGNAGINFGGPYGAKFYYEDRWNSIVRV
jgi:hypothetical protein